MPGVSAEQVKMAKEVDLLSYLQASEPHELRKSGADEYRTASNGSLVISKGLWFWNRGQQGGRSAVDYLMKIRGMGFVDAIETVLDSRAVAISTAHCSDKFSALLVEKSTLSQKTDKAPLVLPEAATFPANVVSYLQKRGISPEVINQCLEAGILYESRKSQNAIFIGKDGTGKPRFACARSTKGDFKADLTGSDKRYSFTLPAKNPSSRHLSVFESPVDLLSHATLQQRNKWDFDVHRLSLGGTSSVALISFLERNPQIKRIVLHLDIDIAGLTAAKKIKAQLGSDRRFKHINTSINPPRHGAKDYNDVLLRSISVEREHQHQQPSRQRADFSL